MAPDQTSTDEPQTTTLYGEEAFEAVETGDVVQFWGNGDCQKWTVSYKGDFAGEEYINLKGPRSDHGQIMYDGERLSRPDYGWLNHRDLSFEVERGDDDLVTDRSVDVETDGVVCRRCSGTVVENTSDRFEAGDAVTHFVRCIDCGSIGWVRIIDERVAELVDVVRPDDYSDYSATLANPTPVAEWIGDWRQSAVDAGVIDESELVTDGGVDVHDDTPPTNYDLPIIPNPGESPYSEADGWKLLWGGMDDDSSTMKLRAPDGETWSVTRDNLYGDAESGPLWHENGCNVHKLEDDLFVVLERYTNGIDKQYHLRYIGDVKVVSVQDGIFTYSEIHPLDDDDEPELVTDGGVDVHDDTQTTTIDARTIAETVWDVARDRADGREGDRWFDAQGNVFREERKSGLTDIDDIVDVNGLMTGHPLPLRQDDDYEEIRELVVTELANTIFTEEKPQLVTDGGVTLEVDDYPTCNGVTNTGEDCQRRLADNQFVMHEEDNYCHDHTWQARFVTHYPASLARILPESETVSIEVYDVQMVEYDYHEIQRIETQYGVAEVGADRTVRAGRIYDATAGTDPYDFNQLTLKLSEVGVIDDD